MTITYPTGAVREATLLSEIGDESFKVVTSADGKIRTFQRLQDGEWYSEACEPVTIVFHTVIGI
jgi:hypothetical protein